jgi:hypothetical protein
MSVDNRLLSDRFRRACGYHPERVLAGAGSAANALWLTEWLAEALDLRPGIRVLDLSSGRATFSDCVGFLRFWAEWLSFESLGGANPLQ